MPPSLRSLDLPFVLLHAQGHFERCLFTSNEADNGGAIAVAGTAQIVLADETAVRRPQAAVTQVVAATDVHAYRLRPSCQVDTSNKATGDGRSTLLEGLDASISYVLPTPLGYWINAIECKEYRLPCVVDNCNESAQPLLPTQPCVPEECAQICPRTICPHIEW